MPIILSIGQCGFDDSRLGEMVRNDLGATMDRAASPDEAQRKIAEKKYDLILVNRIFDAGGDSGISFIKQLKQGGDTTPIMLVSNYEDAQKDAVAAGALPGFGKSALGTSQVANLLRTTLGARAEK